MAKRKRNRRVGCLKTLLSLFGLVFILGIALSLLPGSESDIPPEPTPALDVERVTVVSLDVDEVEFDPTATPADTPVVLEPTSSLTPAPIAPPDGSSEFNEKLATSAFSTTATPIAEKTEDNPLGQSAKVMYVVDGDTIAVQIDGQPFRVRYILIDTPEKDQYYFNEATAANRALVDGQTVYLQRDVSETDRYGRLLRYVYLEDGTFVNAELVRQGYAMMATYPPDVSKEAEIRKAQQEAIEAGVGLWATEYAEPVPVANSGANLRSGPGTAYPVQGGVPAGAELNVVYTNPAGDWYQLDSGLWIAGFLVDNAPESPPVARNIPPPPTQAQVETPTVTPVSVRSGPAQAAVCECGGNFYNCSDFGSHSQAQACFEYCRSVGRGDIHRLDRDRDGSACESLP